MAVAWAIGAGLGLATLAGFRVFVPLAVFILFARLGWAWGFAVSDTPFASLQSNLGVAVLLILVVLEVVATRVASLVPLERKLRLPIAVIVGALLLAAAASGEVAYYWLGLPLGGALAFLGFYVHQGLVLAGDGVDPGPALDLLVLALAAVAMLLPPSGFVFVPVVLWLAYRVRRLKRQKYKGLRVLA